MKLISINPVATPGWIAYRIETPNADYYKRDYYVFPINFWVTYEVTEGEDTWVEMHPLTETQEWEGVAFEQAYYTAYSMELFSLAQSTEFGGYVTSRQLDGYLTSAGEHRD